jgi:Tfp pilus assembly protein PilO
MPEISEEFSLKAAINRHKSALLNIAIVLAGLYFAAKIYAVELKKIKKLTNEKEISLKKNEVLAEIGRLENKLEAYKSFRKKDKSLAINTIADLAKKSSVRIITVNPEPENPSDFFTLSPFNLNLEMDTYNALGKFISNLESHTDIYIIDSMSIKPHAAAEGAGNKMKLVVSLKISTASFK